MQRRVEEIFGNFCWFSFFVNTFVVVALLALRWHETVLSRLLEEGDEDILLKISYNKQTTIEFSKATQSVGKSRKDPANENAHHAFLLLYLLINIHTAYVVLSRLLPTSQPALIIF